MPTLLLTHLGPVLRMLVLGYCCSCHRSRRGRDGYEQANCVCYCGRIPFPVPLLEKFTQSPAFVYFVAAMSVVCLYSLITALATLTIVQKRPVSRVRSLLFFLIWDAVMLGLVASATGTAGGVAYIGWKGNKHTGWTKICKVYDNFCHHVAGSIGISLFAGLVLLILVALSAHSFRRCIPK